MNIYGYPYYDERKKWAIIAAGIIAAILVLAGIFYALRPKDVEIRWDSKKVKRGDFARLWVVVRNNSKNTMELVRVCVYPVSPFLRIYSEQNSECFDIPMLAAGAEAQAEYAVYVSENAYAGDHAVDVNVLFPSRSVSVQTKIRVV